MAKNQAMADAFQRLGTENSENFKITDRNKFITILFHFLVLTISTIFVSLTIVFFFLL